MDSDEEAATDNIASEGVEARRVMTRYYSLAGLSVEHPSEGDLLIRVEIYDNGEITYSKIIY